MKPYKGKPITKCEGGGWIDTEGFIYSEFKRGRGLYEIIFTQREREPLEDYCEGARMDGIPCKVHKIAAGYHARIGEAENVAKEISLTPNWIRTKTRLAQIEKFKNTLLLPRKKLDIRIERARKILGV